MKVLIYLFLLILLFAPVQAQAQQHLYYNVGGVTNGVWTAWANFDRTGIAGGVSLVDLAGNSSYPVANYGSLVNPAPESVYQAYYYYLAQGVRVGMKFTTADGIVANRSYVMRTHIWANVGFDSPRTVSVWLQDVSQSSYSSNNLGNAQILEYTVTANSSGEVLYEIDTAGYPQFATAVEFIEQTSPPPASASNKSGMFFGM